MVKKPMEYLKYIVFIISFLGIICSGSADQVRANEAGDLQVYVVYMGEKTPNMQVESVNTTSSYQHEYSVARAAMVYTYNQGFYGFAAKLTKAQAKRISDLPAVVKVFEDTVYQVKTTNSWDFLGLPSPVSNDASSYSDLLSKTNMGEDVIIGVLDTGVWPESKSFQYDEDAIGPIPSRWKGFCDSGPQFDPKTCNRKLIGARFYGGKNSFIREILSPIDADGHGTHVAATAAGYFIKNASFKGVLAPGIARGGAPKARIAVYKVCWTFGCQLSDILMGFDQAISDGVDVISISVGGKAPFTILGEDDVIGLGSFHAVSKGIPVVAACGNDGPYAQTVGHVAPWIVSVAASTLNRIFTVTINLADNQTFTGQALNVEKTISTSLFTNIKFSLSCESVLVSIEFDPVANKVVTCFGNDKTLIQQVVEAVTQYNASALLLATNSIGSTNGCYGVKIPCIEVDYETGTKMHNYIAARSIREPLITIEATKSVVSNQISPQIALFSSRGPSSVSPAILKPDIAAPGVHILAQTSPLSNNQHDSEGYAFMSGTSMATPHVSGIVALLKALHSDWSPAAIRSAMVTTASTTDATGGPILAQGFPPKIADPFDYGGGIVNPNGAADPGLVYDMYKEDYINYFCAMGYDAPKISKIIGEENVINCPPADPGSLLNINLPSFSVPYLMGNSTSVTLRRKVTNVGPLSSTYKVLVENPPGVTIAVTPPVLVFTPVIRRISFAVTVLSNNDHIQLPAGVYQFGSITWTDGDYHVRSPVLVRRSS
ncbi:hypothetical protein C5167_013311 [Papaver somniferum]|uniref:Uncharacterized protein n=2 Tax=Papaver somniferum TaxID=3469 RepID=A0A4Y7J1Y4_PAPSO|nr:hypothetical protein C5167_013311 [Papaver somniferum]